MTEVPPERVDRYYGYVERHLRDVGVWEATIRKFPPKAIRAAVRRILEIIAEAEERGVYVDPETLDWGSIFERLRDYERVEDFIGALQTEGVIPVDTSEVFLAEAERVIEEAGKKVVEAKRLEELLKLERMKESLLKRQREIEARQKALEERERRFEEEIKKKVTPIRIRFLKDYPPWHRAGTVVETYDFDWALELVKKGIAEKVVEAVPAPPRPPTKELTEEEKKRLEDLFRATLFRELGRIPRDAMSEFRIELETVKALPYEEAAKAIESLARDIAERERARVPVGVPPAPPVAPPPTPPAVPPEVKPVKPPAAPIELMAFPRRLASSEINAFWDAFVYELVSAGLNPDDYMEHWRAFRDAWFSDWFAVLRAFDGIIADIKAGKPPRVYPRTMAPMPWKRLPHDAVLHLLWLRIAKDMDELIALLNMNGVYTTPQEVTLIVKEEWKKPPNEISSWLKFTPREYIKKILGVEPEDP